MAVTAADARTVDQLLSVIRAGGQPESQHRQLREFLAGTSSRVLVEASPRDRIWGIGLAADDERAGSPERWPGLNLRGAGPCFPGRSARQNTGTAARGGRGRIPVENVSGCETVQSHLHVG